MPPAVYHARAPPLPRRLATLTLPKRGNQFGQPKVLPVMRIPVMRNLAIAVLALAALFQAGAADAKVLITIDKSTQRMTVSVDGAARWTWRSVTARRS